MAKLVNIGFGNLVSIDRILAIVSPESAPIKRMMIQSKETGKLIDATYGRKTRAVIITDTGTVILSSLQPVKIGERAERANSEKIKSTLQNLSEDLED